MIGNINHERPTFGVSPQTQAASFGAKTADSGFEETLKSSMGFGARGESGGRVNSVSAVQNKTGDMLGQLQLSFLKTNSVNAIDNKMNGGLF